MRQAFWQSLFLHFLVAGIFLLGSFLFSFHIPARKIKVEIKEVPSVKAQETEPKPSIQLNPKLAPPPPKAVKKVFGLSKATLQSDSPGAVEVKAGNTLAKEIDHEKLAPGDADSLPIPTEEYLVTQMPRLKAEVRVPYPPEAKSKNIEGAVIMDILIDDQGRVRSAELVDGPGFGLNEAALKAIYKFEFHPAVVDKKSVAVKIRYAYRFVLN